MRFESLALERYGAFTDRTLHFRSDAHVHVVHGANEAGKTSALSAIGDFLFGFGHLTSYDFDHEAKTLRIGATLRLADGSALSARRRKGRENTLVDAEDRPIATDRLAALVGGVTRPVFAAEFGLTAHMLRAGGQELMKAGGRLAETLAASSAGLSVLSSVRGAVDRDAETLFSPRRVAGKDFYKATDRHEAAERQLRDAIVTIDAWKAANQAVKDAAEAKERLKAEYDAVARDLGCRERTRRTRPKLLAIRQMRADLEAFGDLPDVPRETIAAWSAAVDADARLREQLADLDEADAHDLRRVETLAVDEDVLSAGAEIARLRERIGAVAKARADLPRRVADRRAALESLVDATQRLGLATVDMLLARLPTDAALARIRGLLPQARHAGERLQEASGKLSEAQAEQGALAEDGAPASVSDPAPLKRRLDAFANVPIDADRLRRDGADLDAEERRAAEEAAALNPAVAALDALAVRPLPSPEDIAGAARRAEAFAEDLRRLEADLAATSDRIAEAERDIDRLSAAGVTATRADLLAARGRRDAALTRLADCLDDAGLRSERRDSLASVDAASRGIDEVTDRLLFDAQRSARRDATQERLGEARAERIRLACKLDAIILQRDQETAAWRGLWTASGIVPLEPSRMARWREQVAALLRKRQTLAQQRTVQTVIAEKLEAARQAMAAFAADLGLAPAAILPAEFLFRLVSDAVDGTQVAWTEARTRDMARKNAERAVKRATEVLAKARDEDARWRAEWPDAVAGLGLRQDASFAEAEAALAVWQRVPVDKTTFERESRSVDGIERDLKDFAGDVAALTAAVAADLFSLPPNDALSSLTHRLERSRRASEERALLQEAAKERQKRREPLASKLRRAAPALAAARASAGLPDDAPLALFLTRLGERQAAQMRLSGLMADLSSEGLDEAELQAEQAGIDLGTLDQSIEALRLRQAQLVGDEIGAARTRLDQAQALVAALAAGRDAEGAARAKAEAATDILDIAERWLVRAAAGKLAGLAIERHRASVQDPLIARASELFATVTADAFCGLATAFDDGDVPVLVARRADGRTLAIEGLSEGTRDQLFLVLRLALLERRTAEPLPFIADDLLASFDEPRTAQALDLLAAFGRSRQVILFTHHAHVADIARKQLGTRADIVAL